MAAAVPKIARISGSALHARGLPSLISFIGRQIGTILSGLKGSKPLIQPYEFDIRHVIIFRITY